eukprot:m.307543 g.307543  ORF g.307543 m.307543 type:complete len:291 (+) comp42432_c0_seq1:56-928(+)
MGCGSSQAVATVQVKPSDAPIEKPIQTPESETSRPQSSRSGRLSRSMQSLKAKNELKSTSSSVSSTVRDSDGADGRKGISSTRTSAMTIDSGIGREARNHVEISADSETSFGEENPDLSISGTSLSRQKKLSGSLDVPASDMNVVERPASRSGRAFDITFGGSEDSDTRKAKLTKLENARKNRKELSREQLEERLRKATERREELEKKLLAKIAQQNEKEKKVRGTLQSFVETQSKKTEQMTENLEKNKENRAAYLKNLRDKLKAKEEHARMVRENKRNALPLRDAQEAR